MIDKYKKLIDMCKKYNLWQGGEYKAECGNYHKKAGDDRNCLQCKLFIKYL